MFRGRKRALLSRLLATPLWVVAAAILVPALGLLLSVAVGLLLAR
jgi:hypothetical protein